MPDSPLEVPIEISDAQIDAGLRFMAKSLEQSDELAGSITKAFKNQQEELNKIRGLTVTSALREQVRLENEITKAKEEQAEALEKMRKAMKPQGDFFEGMSKRAKQVWKDMIDPKNIAGLIGGHAGSLAQNIVGGHGASGAISGIGQAAGSVASMGLGALGATIAGPIGEIVGQQIGQIIGPLASGLASALEKAAPAAMKQLDMALDDISAVIGQVFAPALQMAIPPVRLFGDILATILPNAQEVGEATQELQTIIGDMMTSARQVWGDLGPIIRSGLIEGLRLFAHWLDMATMPLRIFQAVFAEVVDALTGGPGENGLRSSQGYASRQAQFTSFAGYQQSFQTAALMAGKGGGATQAQIPGMVQQIRDILRENLKPLRDTVETIRSLIPGGDAAKQRAAIEHAAGKLDFNKKDTQGRKLLSPEAGKAHSMWEFL